MATSTRLGEAWIELTTKEADVDKAATSFAGKLSSALGTVGLAGVAAAGAGLFGASMINPALMEQLGFAVTDLFAAIGESLVPIIQEVIPLIRLMGDVVATVSPYVMKLTMAIADMIRMIVEFLGDTFDFVLSELNIERRSASGMSGAGSAKMGGIVEAQREFQLKALQASAGMGRSVPEQQLEEQRKTNGILGASLEALKNQKPAFAK